MRNPNGAGSVYRLKGKRRRPWIARVSTMIDGHQVFQTIGYGATKTEALELLAKHKVNPISPKADITFGELYQEWAAAKYPTISKSTQGGYEISWRYLSRWEDIKVADIRTPHIQQAIDACYAEGKSKSMLTKLRTTAAVLLKYAMQNDIIDKNYAEFVQMPKMSKPKKQRFTDLEIKKLWKLQGEPWVDTALMLIYTGFRLNELLGLTKFNVNLEQRIFQGAGLKTDAGKNRTVPILDEIFPIVQRRYSQCQNYLIETAEGGKVNSDWYRKAIYYPIIERAEISRLSPHCCRHTFISILAEKKVPNTIIQAIVGHASFSTTADNYVHHTPEALREAISGIKF